MRMLLPAVIVTVLILWSMGTGAAVIHVPADQLTIRHGMEAAADGDTVLVADGTWTGFWNTDLDFLGKAITVESENGPTACIIDCQVDGRGFIFQSGEDQASVVQGFTIANGIHGLGGGIHCLNSSPTIRNLVISQCRAVDQGGGIYCENSAPDIINCVIDGCHSEEDGGGLYFLNAIPTISGCTISNNNASIIYAHGYGGGIACFEGSAPVITDTVFSGNHANNSGGGIFGEESSLVIRTSTFEANQAEIRGGAVKWAGGESVEISGCEITGNQAFSSTGGIELTAVTGLIADNLVQNNQAGGIECSGEFQVTGNTVDHNSGYGGIVCYGPVTISNNIIIGNYQSIYGGGITCWGGAALVSDNIIMDNDGNDGGGIHCRSANAKYTGNLISGNSADYSGGGIYTSEGSASTFINNLVIGNTARDGGGIAGFGSNPWYWNTTVTGNSATRRAGGVLTTTYTHARMINAIIWGNSAPEGNQVYVHDNNEASRLTIRYSDVEGGQDDIPVDPGCSLGWGAGMIDAAPLYTTGPLGDHYLSQVAAGQTSTSPCVDAGDPTAGIVDGTTRTDEEPDEGVADMGYHYSYGDVEPRPFVIAGLGPGPDNPPRIRVFPAEEGAIRTYAFQAYGTPQAGVNLGSGDVNGDFRDEILSGPGPGELFGPHVRGFRMDGTPLPGLSFFAYSTNKYGVNVAAGDFDGDGIDEIITGPGPGEVFGPHVRGWNYDGSGTVIPVPGVSFFRFRSRR